MKNLGDFTSPFVLGEKHGSMAEIVFRFPSVFGRRVTLPCGQVQSLARGALVRDNVVCFVFFFGVN